LPARKLKVRFVDGPLDGQRWTLREPFEPVLPFGDVLYELHDRGEHVRQLRFEYRYAPTWSQTLDGLSDAERYARLRGAFLHSASRRFGG
jgi:hypothetical protein